MQLELVGSVNIPEPPEFQVLAIDAKELKKLRRAKIINLEAYVYLALKIQYGDKSHMRIHSESFCQDWKILLHEMGAAVACAIAMPKAVASEEKFARLQCT